MDCSINEECLSFLHLLWEEEKRIESNKEQVILLFFFLAPSYCCTHFNCCFENLLLNSPCPSTRDVDYFLSVFGDVKPSFCSPPGARGQNFQA